MGKRVMQAATAMALTMATAGFATTAVAAPNETATSSPGASEFGVSHRPVCASVPQGRARCHALEVTGKGRKPGPQPAVSYGATDLQQAYGVAVPSGAVLPSGPTVAIVDAYDSPDAAAHLLAYRQAMGLPVCGSGDTANVDCFFTKYDQRGVAGGPYPPANTGWAQEIDLDVQMVSALCPYCAIALVEADSNFDTDLAAAVDAAAGIPGVTAISNSYGGPEYAGDPNVAGYSHPGIAVVASSGDSGYGVETPAAYPTVIAVGGTALRTDGTTWTETAWSGAGSGCSAYVARPSWQASVASSCPGRLVADVAAVADPNTGARVYTTGSSGTGWFTFGGTSVAAPLVATILAVSGVPAGSNDASALYNPTVAHLYDVTTGTNGRCTKGKTTAGALLCTAGTGWDGPTGNGTPRGTLAF